MAKGYKRTTAANIFRIANDCRLSSHVLVRELEQQSKALRPHEPRTAGVSYLAAAERRALPARVPHIVLAALSSEIYLKCIYVLAHKELPPQRHELDKLLERLPKDYQSTLAADWIGVASIHPIFAIARRKPRWRSTLSLPRVLRRSSIAFVQFRYAWETHPKWFYIPNLEDVLHNFVLSKRPKWGKRVAFEAAVNQ
jgi:hypothetical protein